MKIERSTALIGAAVLVASMTTIMTPAAFADEPDSTEATVIDQPAIQEALEGAATLVPSDEDGIVVEGVVDDVSVAVPVDSAGPLVIQAVDGPTISITLPAADTSAAAQPLTGSTVAYDNADGSTTVPVIGADGVIQVLTVLSEEGATSSFSYVIDVDGGGGVTPLPDGGFAVLDAAGDEIATATAPWAVDANGGSVPTRYEISANVVTQIVDDSAVSKDAYPVVADPAITVTRYEYIPINVTTKTKQPNLKKLVGGCKTAVANTTCTVSGSYTVGATVNATMGLSASQVGTTIGMSASASITGAITCTSPKMPARSEYKAYIMGTFKYFDLQKWKVTKAGGITARRLMETSRNQVAFTPINMLYCTR
ncbi:hypothetical protein QE374_002783 [Microbacterium sp. SORGH_AS428]|uniref:hypothetical protein n=1 Tax=Microbacterium sp. SORGH_AS_0428 TaxID=3041788 RepID=UPI0028641BA1|nr:hypothetical protein [Microbacterium sp. SORGH_AS_0428]MDR6200874.1 hypothetical protein [Microbacterium sp. SORGH_AS_0428]